MADLGCGELFLAQPQDNRSFDRKNSYRGLIFFGTLRGQFRGISEAKMLECMNRLC